MPIDVERKREYLGLLVTAISIYTGFCFVIIIQLIFWKEVKNPLVQLALFLFIMCFFLFLCALDIYTSRYLEMCFSPILPFRGRLLHLADAIYFIGVFLWALSICILLFAIDLPYLGWFFAILSVVFIPLLYVIVWKDLVRKVYSEFEVETSNQKKKKV